MIFCFFNIPTPHIHGATSFSRHAAHSTTQPTSTTQHHAAPRSTTQHHAAPRSSTHHYAAPRSTMQHYEALRSTTQHYAAQRRTTQHHASPINTSNTSANSHMLIYITAKPQEKTNRHNMQDKSFDELTSLLGKDILQHILSLIPLPLLPFAMPTCSFWYYTIRFATTHFYPSFFIFTILSLHSRSLFLPLRNRKLYDFKKKVSFGRQAKIAAEYGCVGKRG